MMMFNRTFAIASLVGLLAMPQPTAAQSVYVLHGIPGGDLNLAPTLPVDIGVNGECWRRSPT